MSELIREIEAAPPAADRGARLGFMYLARRPCGRACGTAWVDPGHERETARAVAEFIAGGNTVDRVERFENDPMPEQICYPGCRECMVAVDQDHKGSDRV